MFTFEGPFGPFSFCDWPGWPMGREITCGEIRPKDEKIQKKQTLEEEEKEKGCRTSTQGIHILFQWSGLYLWSLCGITFECQYNRPGRQILTDYWKAIQKIVLYNIYRYVFNDSNVSKIMLYLAIEIYKLISSYDYHIKWWCLLNSKKTNKLGYDCTHQ